MISFLIAWRLSYTQVQQNGTTWINTEVDLRRDEISGKRLLPYSSYKMTWTRMSLRTIGYPLSIHSVNLAISLNLNEIRWEGVRVNNDEEELADVRPLPRSGSCPNTVVDVGCTLASLYILDMSCVRSHPLLFPSFLCLEGGKSLVTSIRIRAYLWKMFTLC